MENQQMANKMTSDQLKVIQQLQQDVRTIKTHTAEELKAMQEETKKELRQMRE